MIWEFVKKYYIDSIVYKTGYNPVNTATWALILVVAVYYLYRFLSKRIIFDERFFLSNVPYVLFGSFLRIFEDAGFVKPPLSYMLMSPFIYVLVFLVTFASLLTSLKLRGERYWVFHCTLGSVLATFTLSFLLLNLRVRHLDALFIPLTFAISLTAVFYPISRRIGTDGMGILLFFSHMLDASATFYGITYLGYWELHVVPRILVNKFGAWILIPVKFAVFVAILWIIEREENYQLRNFVKFVLLVLGLAPATRDVTRMVFYV